MRRASPLPRSPPRLRAREGVEATLIPLPSSPTLDYVLTWNGSAWVSAAIPAAPVPSVFGRTGAVTAESGDYSSFYDALGAAAAAQAAAEAASDPAGSAATAQANAEAASVPLSDLPLSFAHGGTGNTSAQAALNALAAAVTSGEYLRGNGTNVVMSAIQAADVPTLNQSTTGTAANLSGTPALPNGTTATTQSAGDNSTKLATTAYVSTAIAALSTVYDALGAAATAQSNAESFATSAASTAQSNAESFATSAVGVETSRAETAEALKLALAGGTMSGAIAMGANKITGLANGTVSTDAAAYGQIAAGIAAMAWSGGDLAGTGLAPTLAQTVNSQGVVRASSFRRRARPWWTLRSVGHRAGHLEQFGLESTRTPVIDAVIGDSISYGTGSSPGLTDWATILSTMECRANGLPDPGIGWLRATGWSTLGAGQTPPNVSVSSVTLSTSSTTVTASAFTGIVPGMTVTVSSGTGTLAANTYVVSVSGGNCVLSAAPTGNGTATLSFANTLIQGAGPAGSSTGWQISASQAIGDGVTATGGAITVASVTLTSGSTAATVRARHRGGRFFPAGFACGIPASYPPPASPPRSPRKWRGACGGFWDWPEIPADTPCR